MYAVLNILDTTAVRNTLRTLLLTAICIVGMLIAYYAAIVVLPLIVAALGAAITVVVTVASAIVHAATYAVTTLAAVTVRMVVVVALIRALPWLWRATVALYRNREGIAVVAKGLVLCAVVVGCFLGAILVA